MATMIVRYPRDNHRDTFYVFASRGCSISFSLSQRRDKLKVYPTLATIFMRVNDGLAAEQLSNPGNVDEAALPIFIGSSSSFTCGAIARVSLHIDDEQRIVDATFKVAGCTVLVSALTALTERVKNTTTAEAAAFAEDLETIQRGLSPEAADRGDCVLLASEALLEAIRAFSNSAREHWNGDDALICTCFGVSERTIENEIQTKQLDSIAAVTRACNAGAGCRSCYPLIEDILEAVNSKW